MTKSKIQYSSRAKDGSYKAFIPGLNPNEENNLYEETFESNFELLKNKKHQDIIRKTPIAVAGVGGVGSNELMVAIRNGFTKFTIADPDTIETKNAQRQAHSYTSTVGRKKVEVMAEMLLDVYPYSEIKIFDTKINETNIDKFLEGIKITFDAIDFYAIQDRRTLINTSLKKEIPAISSGPVGIGAAYSIFHPTGPNFDEYFGVDKNTPYNKMLASFLVGITPGFKHMEYMNVKGVNLKERKSPSSPASMSICAGTQIAATIDIITNTNRIKHVPYTYQFDVPTGTLVCTKSGSNKGFLRKLKVDLIERILDGEEYNKNLFWKVLGKDICSKLKLK